MVHSVFFKLDQFLLIVKMNNHLYILLLQSPNLTIYCLFQKASLMVPESSQPFSFLNDKISRIVSPYNEHASR